MPSGNEVVIAAAGSGKTRHLVQEALADRNSRVLITTYTRENLREIELRLWEAAGTAPHSVTVMSWYEFLLRQCVKPYQSYKTEILSIRSINFDGKRHPRAKKMNFHQYYVDKGNNLYMNTVSDLVCALDNASAGKVVVRLSQCFDAIFIDELQDLAGYDLDFLVRLLKSGVRILGVADPRQSVLVTNNSPRNSQLRRAAIMDWITAQQKAGLLLVTELTESYRCNQRVCDFGDWLHPNLPKTVSKNFEVVEDMGVYLVHVDDLEAYRVAHISQELRWNKTFKGAINAMNFGEVKGMTFPRVLIHATKPMLAFVESGNDLAPEARAKFYVAVTRARHSVGIVTGSKTTKSALAFWVPPLGNLSPK
jgi:DNA helicase-2/ATP-dependent DNA helicase PcrA